MDDAEAFESLQRLFHEPSRLAILSELLNQPQGLTFGHLKRACGLTDGNLNRHLKTLEEARVIRISKKFVANKPQTTAAVTREGFDRFSDYLGALERVFKQAHKAASSSRKSDFIPGDLGAQNA